MSKWSEYKKRLGDTRPWDLIDPSKEKSDEVKQNDRMSICLACPELIKLTKQCKQCGCFMPLKTKLEEAVCPIGKW